jgi:CrcB protein
MIWSVALGGAVGSVSRLLLAGFLQRHSGTSFPVWTLVVNVSGSILLGFLMRYLVDGVPVSVDVRAMLTTGFCGGYTTFSTFSYETVALFEQGDWRRGSAYVLASVTLSLAGTLLGIRLARALIAMAHGAA